MGTLLLYPSNERHPFNTIKMKAFVAVLCSAAAASGATIAAIPAPVIPATTIVRAPAHDSATIESHRLGGNFAYATAEAHAFAKVSPQLATRTVPVAETTHIHTPAAIRTVQPAAVKHTQHVAQPILAQQQLYRNEAVIGPVATHTTYEQPIYKTRHYTQTVQAHHQVTAPALVQTVAAAPVEAIGYTGLNAGLALAPGHLAAGAAHLGYAAAPGLLVHGAVLPAAAALPAVVA